MKLQGKTAVITGAGSGIGRGVTHRFASEGAHVIAIDVNRAAGTETVRQIEQAGGMEDLMEMDVSESTGAKTGMKLAAPAWV